MNAFGPAIIDPTGAPNPFDKQNITESTFRVITATWSPSAVAALKMRAPSRCTFNPILCACSQISSTCRSEEHTSELQSHLNLECRLLLEKKNENTKIFHITSQTNHLYRSL